jgi:hypothetical protein
MLAFLVILVASVGAVLLVQAMDIECVKPAARRRSAGRNHAVKSDTSYPDGAVAGALR